MNLLTNRHNLLPVSLQLTGLPLVELKEWQKYHLNFKES